MCIESFVNQIMWKQGIPVLVSDRFFSFVFALYPNTKEKKAVWPRETIPI